MKILSCHIENFGRLHDYSVTFSGGANRICEENGWGKSTFAAFLRAMFYGLEGDRKRSIEENERKRYQPWQGGVFGGQIVFEIQGKTYLISRVFKDKEANDEFELRDAKTNLPSGDYTDRIGEEIFKINRESFARTVFIEQNRCETSPTDDIHAKVGHLADHTNDLNHFEAAVARLTELINQWNPKRATGSIAKRNEEIARYERMVKSGGEIADSMKQYEAKLREEEAAYDTMRERMKELGEIQKKVAKQQAVLAKKAEWERLKGTADRKRREKEACERKFPGDIPLPEDVKKKIAECHEMERAHDRMAMYRMAQEEKDDLASLEELFARGTPPDADMEEMFGKAKAFREIRQAYASEQLSSAERERLEELAAYFANETEHTAAVVGKWNSRNARKDAMPSKQAALRAMRASVEAQRSERTPRIAVLLILGIVLVAAGLLVVWKVSPAAGAGTAAVGAVLLAAGLWENKKAKQSRQKMPPEYEALRRAMEEDEAFVAGTDEEVADYLTAHGKSFQEDTVPVVLQEIVAESVEYASLKQKLEKAMSGTKERELDALRHSLAEFLGRYGIASADAGFSDDLYRLRDSAEKYRGLREKQDHFAKAEKEYGALREELLSFLREYALEASDVSAARLGDIRDAAAACVDARKASEEAVEELERFEAEHTVLAWSGIAIDESLPTLEELNQLMQQLTETREQVHNRISSYDQTLEDLQREYDEWEENSARLRELRAIQDMEKKKYEYVNLARKKLELAKEAMTAKYAEPLFLSFRQYYQMISGCQTEDFHMDANAAITVDEYGRQRGTNTLSVGRRDLIGICLRVALVDAMYQEEKPPLILDDPFTNLDDGKVRAGLDFIEELAKKYQIIYFTCSAARG